MTGPFPSPTTASMPSGIREGQLAGLWADRCLNGSPRSWVDGSTRAAFRAGVGPTGPPERDFGKRSHCRDAASSVLPRWSSADPEKRSPGVLSSGCDCLLGGDTWSSRQGRFWQRSVVGGAGDGIALWGIQPDYAHRPKRFQGHQAMQGSRHRWKSVDIGQPIPRNTHRPNWR